MPDTVKKGRGATSAMISTGSNGIWLSRATNIAAVSGNQLVPLP